VISTYWQTYCFPGGINNLTINRAPVLSPYNKAILFEQSLSQVGKNSVIFFKSTTASIKLLLLQLPGAYLAIDIFHGKLEIIDGRLVRSLRL
jgi:hypothetical protein